MGANIHMEIDIYEKGKLKWHYNVTPEHIPFKDRWYRLFAFLANVRNSESVPPLSEPRGIPGDRLEEAEKDKPTDKLARLYYEHHPYDDSDYYGFSWVLLSELLNHDYEKTFYNTEEKRNMTVREFLSPGYFEVIENFKQQHYQYDPENVRLFFYFDN